jgi:hypothetical protein
VLGSDANDGSAWGASYAWKTIKTGATAARIAPGDTIKIAKSPDPTSVGDATWNLNSKTVTLAAAKTETIDNCDSAWAASADVTASLPTTGRKEGSANVTLTIATAFTTGKVGYKQLPAQLDLSGYQQISFWFRNSLVFADNALKICLCSDSSGSSIVDEFIIPACETAQVAVFKPYTLNKGSALGSAINSVAIYAITDPGAAILMIDNIIAVKAVGSADSLSLTSLISKNSLATGGAEPWYPIQSINGTTVLIDNGAATIATAGRGASSPTETVTTYKRECFRTVTTTDCAIQDSGASGSLINFEGGYNPGTDTQNGETFFDVGTGIGAGLDLTSKNYVKLNRLNMVRAQTGVTLSASTECEVYGHTLCGCAWSGLSIAGGIRCKANFVGLINNVTTGISMSATCLACEVTIGMASNNLTNGINTAACYSGNRITAGKANNNGSANISFGALTYDLLAEIQESKDGAAYGLEFITLSKSIVVSGLTTSGNSSGAISHASLGNNLLRGCTLGETVKVASQVAWGNSRLASDKQDGSAENNYTYTDGGYIKSQTAIRHTASGLAWALYPTHANRGTIQYPVWMPIARLAVYANAQVTFTAWLLRSNAGIQANILCRGSQIAGVSADVLSSNLSSVDAWEQRSITFTPTEAGVVEIMAIAYGGTAYYAVVDDIDYYQV